MSVDSTCDHNCWFAVYLVVVVLNLDVDPVNLSGFKRKVAICLLVAVSSAQLRVPYCLVLEESRVEVEGSLLSDAVTAQVDVEPGEKGDWRRVEMQSCRLLVFQMRTKRGESSQGLSSLDFFITCVACHAQRLWLKPNSLEPIAVG